MKLDSVVFYSSDIRVIADYYQNRIGLELEYSQGDKYVSFKFENGVRLGIKRATESREVPGSQTLFVGVEDAKAEYDKALDKGLDIHKELANESWGVEFSVLDPDGNKIEYLQRKQVSNEI